ncbi:YchF/TatD family DNA exonuclease [Rosenbergiella australiborealis]|uniref:YchF/TatD family DNA exonuclease n=1 Tax=Rosenbergiella australiborealis TaxID=1544696 RepID=A0ABS5T2M0_9GAMM|nr:YchF/TatD family DNA exonuclease [Rosenbergiella australiborealis]MBT0726608.1 YchF/TatD family DNA exonuclease [Rosenbergiella australiborealis]
MFLVDSHCHVDGLDYEKEHQNLAEVIEKAAARDVRFMLAVSTTLSQFPALQRLTADFDQIALSCGVHPLNLDDNWDVERLHQLASDPKVVALGETGLDYFYHKTPELWAIQQQAFREHLQVACKLNKPVIVHTRDAREDTVRLLAEEHVDRCGGVLHCFTEDRETAKQLLDLGMYISFSGILTFKNAEQIREAARFVPLDRILVETDSPYLAPVPYRGKANQPAYTRDVAEYLAVVKGVTVDQVAEQTTENFAKLFNIAGERLALS